jgi:Tfp pilus assembly protein PilV
MISFVVGLAILLAVAAFVLARKYMRDRNSEGMAQWLDAHHMGWMHHKH